MNCSETFYKDRIDDELHTAEAIKLTKEEKQKLTELFKRVSEFDESLGQESDEDDQLSRLAEINFDDVDERDLSELLGAEMYVKFKNYVGSQSVDKSYTPWWKSSKIITERQPGIIADLPAFRTISKSMPSEFLWNNLIDILFVCVYLMHVYLGEIDDVVDEFCSFVVDLSTVLSNSGALKHESVPVALNTVLRRIRQHEDVSNPDVFIAETLYSLAELVRVPENILRALCHLHSVFESMANKSKILFLVSKKLYYYCVWMNSEICDNLDLLEEIMSSVVLIIGGLHDSLVK